MKKYFVPIIPKSSTEKEQELAKEICAIEFSSKAFAQAIRYYQDHSHQKTKKTKRRSEIVGTTRKVYAQKGTGNARHGSRKAPIFVGGGVAHGPSGIRPMPLKLSRHQRIISLCMAMKNKAEKSRFFILDTSHFSRPSSKTAQAILKETGRSGRSIDLLFSPRDKKDLQLSFRNLSKTSLVNVIRANTYQIFRADTVIFTQSAFEELQNRLVKSISAQK